MRARSVLLVAASAVVGVACGVGAGLATQPDGSYADPLGVGFPLQNLGCNDDTLLVLGGGSVNSEVYNASTRADPGDEVRYLESARSCRTAYVPEGGHTPPYVVYVVFAKPATACAARMTVRHRGDRVIRLNSSNTSPVQCLCYLDWQTMPVLRPGMVPTALDSMYISALQNMFHAMGRRPSEESTGQYDPATVAAVRKFQSDLRFRPNGVVGWETWRALAKQGCGYFPS
jgi:peptidoglycan hydrolase-like protein with peptidoglycan-binding domain